MPMTHKLTSLCSRISKAQTIHQVIQAHLQDLQKVLISFARATSSGIKGPTELAFQYAIGASHLLLFTQLLGIARFFARAPTAVLSWASIAAFKRAFRHALVAFKKQFYPLSPAELADGAGITCHLVVSSLCTLQTIHAAAWVVGIHCAE